MHSKQLVANYFLERKEGKEGLECARYVIGESRDEISLGRKV